MVESVNGNSRVNPQRGIEVQKQYKSKAPTFVNFVKDKNLTPKQAEALKNLTNLISNGKAQFVDSSLLEDFVGLIMDGRAGDYVHVTGFADPNQKLTFGEAKRILKLNLPPGSLKHNKSERGGGNFDEYDVPKNNGQYYLNIFVDDLEEATGLTKKELLELFPKK